MPGLANKYLLFLLLLLPLYYFWHRFLQKSGQRHLFFSARGLFGTPQRSFRLWLVRHLHLFKLMALGLIIIALARPQWYDAQQLEQNRGMDILLVLDISGSMASMDFKPKNRLEVAKEVIAGFIEKRKTDRLGLIIFSSTAFTKCPLTVDYDILTHFLKQTNLGEIEDGTAIGMGLATAVNRIRLSTAKTKIVILLTDGVNNRGEIDPRDAAKMARDFNVRVYTIGVGTRGRAPYPVTDPLGNRQYIDLEVEIDEPLLREIATKTGGLYFRATDTASLQTIFQEIDRWEKSEINVKKYVEITELFIWPLAVGLLLLALIEVLRRSWLRSLP